MIIEILKHAKPKAKIKMQGIGHIEAKGYDTFLWLNK
jgi:hypothetical protein